MKFKSGWIIVSNLPKPGTKRAGKRYKIIGTNGKSYKIKELFSNRRPYEIPKEYIERSSLLNGKRMEHYSKEKDNGKSSQKKSKGNKEKSEATRR